MTRINQGILAAIVTLAPLGLAAQGTDAGGIDRTGAPKTGTAAPTGWTGSLECVRCIVHVESTGTWVEFGGEPVIRGPRSGEGPLDGDVLVAVGGLLITTPAGGRRLTQPGTLAPMLRIRRGEHEIDFIYPEHTVWTFVDADSTSMKVHSSDASGDSTAQHTDMNFATTRGWLGIALDCLRCTVDREDHSSRDGTIRFTTPPKVVAVEPGAASLAGFATGDVIRTIDGYPMISAKGAERFTTLRPGQRVNFVVERHGTLVTLRLLVPRKP
jgi:hypothetical protein